MINQDELFTGQEAKTPCDCAGCRAEGNCHIRGTGE